MINFKGIQFDRGTYGPYITIKSKVYYHGILTQDNYYRNLYFPKIIIRNGLNVLKQLEPSEPQHSLILGSIINPSSEHGYGDVFLKEFFDIVINDKNFNCDGNEKWFVNIERERFDISIRNNNKTKIIIMENKSNGAVDQQNQLYRYWIDGIYKPQFRFSRYNIPHWAKILYLSPSFKKGYSEQTITRPLNWDKNLPQSIPKSIIKTVYFREELSNWLKKCLELVENTSDMYFYLKQYKDFWG
jgi:hypothetical protein